MTNETRCADPMLPPYTAYCKCAACGLYFNSPHGFDLHRRIKYQDSGDRGCATQGQLANDGWSLNAKGYWITEKRDAA